jgi:hypothetical protein
MNLVRGDEVPQIITPKMRQQASEFLMPSAKRLLQHNRPQADIWNWRSGTLLLWRAVPIFIRTAI